MFTPLSRPLNTDLLLFTSPFQQVSLPCPYSSWSQLLVRLLSLPLSFLLLPYLTSQSSLHGSKLHLPLPSICQLVLTSLAVPSIPVLIYFISPSWILSLIRFLLPVFPLAYLVFCLFFPFLSDKSSHIPLHAAFLLRHWAPEDLCIWLFLTTEVGDWWRKTGNLENVPAVLHVRKICLKDSEIERWSNRVYYTI